ncbi:MAG: formylglycine-generating enzyme family protein [Candidatus Latescibacteria bacterium]|nr:formylglycine-generating enzyme family protein [Candidatus Latescibacterota bacterium]
MRELKRKLTFLALIVLLCFASRVEGVEVVLKSGKVIQGELIRETNTTISLQLASSQIEISKLSIKTIDGRPPFESARAQTKPNVPIPKDVLVPAGDFLMGVIRGKENPVHIVYLDAFRIDALEVTNAAYRAFLETANRKAPRYWNDPKYNADKQPVVGVTYEDAKAYCQSQGKRLPTEAEWERAARGPHSRLFPWGDRFDAERTNTRETKHRRPSPVGSYPNGASPEGVFDMSGNVWEWCHDWFDKEYYGQTSTKNPKGPASGKKRIIRCGGWTAPHTDMAHRRGEKPNKTYPSLGFRCAKSISSQ